MRIDKAYWEDVRKVDFTIKGLKPLLVNRHLKERGFHMKSEDPKVLLRHAIYHIPGRGCQGYPLRPIHEDIRESVKRTSTTVEMVDRYLQLAGWRGYAPLKGTPMWPTSDFSVQAAVYPEWTMRFSVFFVRSVFSVDSVHNMVSSTGYGGIGDTVPYHQYRFGTYEVTEARVDLGDPFTYTKFLEGLDE